MFSGHKDSPYILGEYAVTWMLNDKLIGISALR
jgi:hypothetical protein